MVHLDGKGTISPFLGNATKVEVCLFDPQGEKELEGGTARIYRPDWHGYIKDVGPSSVYGFGCTGRTAGRGSSLQSQQAGARSVCAGHTES